MVIDTDDQGTVSWIREGHATPTRRVAPSPSAIAQGLPAGTSLGRYTIREELGRGGMGVVYRAHDPKLDREVALKILHPLQPSSRATERLVREARALARLCHPHVVTVYDVSTDPLGVLVAMEYIPGPTLRTWLTTRPPWPEVLPVLLEAGQGLAAAHERGLVHRDFKPANVLLGHDGRARVLDFGLALHGEPTSAHELHEPDSVTRDPSSTLTTTGVLMGTPAYMAPEQHANRRADARADQFAFCVTLWECLHGERPYRGSHSDILFAKLRGPPAWPERSPVPPRIARAVRRGLAVDPAERWPSMDALLHALRAPRRRHGAWALGTVAVVLVIGASIESSVEPTPCEPIEDPLAGVWDEARAEQVEQAFMAGTHEYTASAWPGIRRALDDHARAWRDERSAACRATHVEGTQPADVLDLRMACLDRDRSALRALVDAMIAVRPDGAESVLLAAAELPSPGRCADVDALRNDLALPDDPAVAAEVLRVRDQLARARTAFELHDDTTARALFEPLSDAARATGHVPLDLEVQLLLARFELDDGDRAGAEQRFLAIYEQAIAIGYDRVAGEAASLLAVRLSLQQTRPREAETWAETALAVAKRVGEGGELEAMALSALARVMLDGGDYDRAVELYARSLEIHERFDGPGHLRTVVERERLGLALDFAGRHDQALAQLSQARRTLEQTLGPEHPRVMAILSKHAQALSGIGDYAAAEREFLDVLEALERGLGPDCLEIADTCFQLGNLYRMSAEDERARPFYERALRIWEAVYGAEDPHVATAMVAVAVSAGIHGRHEEAERLHRQALRIRRAALEPSHPDIGTSLNNLGMTLVELGRLDEAAETFEVAVAHFERSLAPDHPDMGSPLINLAHIRLEQGRAAEAEALQRRVLALWRAAYGDRHARVAQVEYNLARALLGQDRSEEAVALLTRASTTFEQVLAPNHPYVGEALLELGRAQLVVGRSDEARHALERARAIAVANAGERSSEVTELEVLLARTELVAGQARAARSRLEGVARQLDGFANDADDGTLVLALGDAFVQAGDEARARQLVRKARDALPEGAARVELTKWLERPDG